MNNFTSAKGWELKKKQLKPYIRLKQSGKKEIRKLSNSNTILRLFFVNFLQKMLNFSQKMLNFYFFEMSTEIFTVLAAISYVNYIKYSA